MKVRDLLVIGCGLAGICHGVFSPATAGLATPMVLYTLMVILFLSFLNIDFKALLRLDGIDPGRRALLFSLLVHASASALADGMAQTRAVKSLSLIPYYMIRNRKCIAPRWSLRSLNIEILS